MKRLSKEQKLRNEILARKKFRHNIRRKKKNKKLANLNLNKSKVFYSYGVENFCKKNNISEWKNKRQNSYRIDESVNLYENPEKLIRLLLQILNNAKLQKAYPQLIFSGRIKFGSLYLIDNMCWEIAQKRDWGFHFQNINNEDSAILSKLKSFSSSTFENEKVYILNEKVLINRSENQLSNQQYKVKSKEITDLVVKGVRENSDPNFILDPEAYQAISSTIGEHFDNILLHAPDSEFGYLCGFYDKIAKEVQILIFNFGLTIAESLEKANLPKQVQKEINAVITNHTQNKFFKIASKKFTRENALTLLSLQEGISSRMVYDKSRGHGITDFIEHCFNLNSE